MVDKILVDPYTTEIINSIILNLSKARKFYIKDLVNFFKKQIDSDLEYALKTIKDEDFYFLRLFLEEETKNEIRLIIGGIFVSAYKDLDDFKEEGKYPLETASALIESGFEMLLLAKMLIHSKKLLVDKLLERAKKEFMKEPLEKTMKDIETGLVAAFNENLANLTK